MELVTLMPAIHFKPVEYKKKLTKGNSVYSQSICINNG